MPFHIVHQSEERWRALRGNFCPGVRETFSFSDRIRFNWPPGKAKSWEFGVSAVPRRIKTSWKTRWKIYLDKRIDVVACEKVGKTKKGRTGGISVALSLAVASSLCSIITRRLRGMKQKVNRGKSSGILVCFEARSSD